ncbi:catalase family peroxidase [Xanthobacter oligotrophicus]|uniref:Catalase-related peroxidase n=2 Tax=Xanthobacter oligotrophicus TaxID=2607286 RepID=A0ABW6ZZH7_9HYPH
MSKLGPSLAGAMALALLAAPPARGDQVNPESSLAEQIVDALNQADGAYPGFRANHAKGLVAEGTFAPSAEAAGLSKASLFAGAPVPVTVRFSSGSGIPTVADGSPRANPHGLSVKFHLKDGSETDMVLNSRTFFPVANGKDFRDLELAVAASQAGAPKPTALEKFIVDHPLVAIPLKTPESLAEEQYNGLNAFILTNAAGIRQAVRYQLVPPNVVHLAPEEAAKRAHNFLFDEIRERIGRGPVTFQLRAQLAGPGDPITDATQVWPAERKVVTLGTLTVRKVADDSDKAQRELLFLPGQVTDGIEASDDPLIQARDEAYAVSFARRSR